MALLFFIGGACAMPPEDCGGVPGYAEFVHAQADLGKPAHVNLADRIGTDSWGRPAAFDSILKTPRRARRPRGP